jgi:AcrR family transcriptional regulator
MTTVMIDRGHFSRRVPAGSRRERKKERVRRQLYRAALELFPERGYDGTSVQEICDRADVAKGTFFNYFPSKEHVLLAYHDEIKLDVLRALEGGSFGSAADAVGACFAAWARRIAGERPMARIVVRHMFASDLLLDADRRLDERLHRWLTARLEEGIASGELRSDLEIGLFLPLIGGVLSSTTLDWVHGGAEEDLEELLESRRRFLFRAARPAISAVPEKAAG